MAIAPGEILVEGYWVSQERPLIPPYIPSPLTLIVVSGFLHPANLAQWIFWAAFPWVVWLPYIAGGVILAIGLITVRNDFVQERGLNKIVVLGPIRLAVPLAVFGAEHFTATTIMAGMVPAWSEDFWIPIVATLSPIIRGSRGRRRRTTRRIGCREVRADGVTARIYPGSRSDPSW